MKVLIADDSEHKIDELISVFQEIDIKKQQIEVAGSFKETIKKLMSHTFDLVILDMSMPLNKGSLGKSSRALAGKDVLATVSYNHLKSNKFILFSQFSEFGRHDDVVTLEEIYELLKKDYESLLFGAVIYQSNSNIWKREIVSIIKSMK